MKKGMLKKTVSLLLAVLMMLATLPAAIAADEESVTVTVGNNSLTEAQGAGWYGNLFDEIKVPIVSGETVIDVIIKALTKAINESEDYSYIMDYGFISSINGLANDGSYTYGWMGTVNNIFPSVGFGSIFVRDGDIINIQYLDYYDEDAIAKMGAWGSLNSVINGFSFNVGRLSSKSVGWDTVFTLTLPQGTKTIQVNDVPGNGEKIIYVNDGWLIQYDLNDYIPVSNNDELWILVDGYMTAYQIEIKIVGKDSIDLLLENISAGMMNASGEWQIIGMSAYQKYNQNTANLTSDKARQAYINYAVSVIGDYTKSANGVNANADGEYAKAIIALKSLGINPGVVYPVNSQTPMSAFDKLKNLREEEMSALIYTTTSPYVLQAFRQTDIDFTEQEGKIIEFLLNEQDKSGAWGYYYGGFNADVDTTSTIIASLAPYYLENHSDIVTAVDAALSWLAEQQHGDGTFGFSWDGNVLPSANSTAQAIIAMCSLGIDPDSNDVFAYSAIDGLLSFTTSNFDGFTADGIKDDRETWEGFRALIAAAQFYQTTNAFNVYDFSGNAVEPGRATGIGVVEPPEDPKSDVSITVSFTLKGLGGQTWIGTKQITVPSDAKIYHLFIKALDDAGYSYIGAGIGYISSITTPSGTALTEFQHGVNSGWVYSLNGDLPVIGMISQGLADGDDVVWYYTSDYKKEPGMDAFDNELPAGAAAPAATSTIAAAATVSNGLAVTAISNAVVQEAIKDALEKLEKTEETGAIEIKVSVTGIAGAASVQAEIKAESLKAIAEANEGNAQLTIESGIAALTFDAKTLAGLAKGIDGGAAVTFLMETVDVSALDADIQQIVGDSPVFNLAVTVGDNAIHNFDGTVTVTLPYDLPAGTDPAALTVYWLDADGNPVPMQNAHYDAEHKVFVFTTTHFSLFFIGVAAMAEADAGWFNPFADVKAGDWFYDVVKYVYMNGLMTGTDSTLFSPNMALTRGMAVTVLYRLAGSPDERVTAAEGSGQFSDVEEGAYYYDAVNWAASKGVVAGYGGGLFGPEDDITREQMAAILLNYELSTGKIPQDILMDRMFADWYSIDDWAKNAVNRLTIQGLLSGKPGNLFDPKSNATRAEFAAILTRYVERLSK